MISRVDSRAVPALILAFLVALGSAWIFANPPGAAPDEGSHFVKAVGVGGGDLAGKAPSGDARGLSEEDYEALTKLLKDRSALERVREQSESRAGLWQQRSAREFEVPAGLGFTGFGCDLPEPERSASCLENGRQSRVDDRRGTFMGTYQPYLYLPPGLLLRTVREPLAALRLGRVGAAFISLLLLAAAGALLWDGARGARSLTGLIVAVSPSIVFFASTLSTSGPEISAAVCFSASLIRLTRARSASWWVWALAAAGGAVLAVSRSLGPLFVVVALVAAMALAPRGRMGAALRSARRATAAATGAIVVAIGAGLWWQVKYQPSLGWNRQRILDGIAPAVSDLVEIARQAVGKFGSLESNLPLGVYLLWWLMFALLLGIALRLGSGRERLALVGLCAGVVLLTIGLSAVYRQTGFPLQARHVLPLIVMVPLWAGELINRHPERLRPPAARRLLVGLALAAALAHAVAWYANGRRFAVGTDGSWNFVPSAEWLPPLGWVPWIAVVCAGVLAYAAAARSAARAVT